MPEFQGQLTTKFPDEQYPAPYVAMRVEWRGETRDLLALVDSGADHSVIPALTAHAMRLQKIAEIEMTDANGHRETRDVFTVNLEFHGFSVRALPIAATDYPTILIGRDVLSDWVTELNGPAGTFTLRA